MGLNHKMLESYRGICSLNPGFLLMYLKNYATGNIFFHRKRTAIQDITDISECNLKGLFRVLKDSFELNDILEIFLVIFCLQNFNIC